MQALGTIGFFVGVGLAIYTARNTPSGTDSSAFAGYVLLIVASAICNLLGRVLAWWHHA
jgi:FtsH-binding integral membrane protein